MMSFLTCITGFCGLIWFSGFREEDLNAICYQNMPNLHNLYISAERNILRPLPKLCPVIPTSNQDGRKAQNRKQRDGILIDHCCFSVSQNDLKF
jgi:hypothetical protein